MMVWTADGPPAGGGPTTPSWATINLVAGGAAKRTFALGYASDLP